MIKQAFSYEILSSGCRFVDWTKVDVVEVEVTNGRVSRPAEYSAYVLTDGKVLVSDATLNFIGSKGTGRRQYKIGRRGFTVLTESLLLELIEYNEYPPRNETETKVSKRNMNAIEKLMELV